MMKEEKAHKFTLSNLFSLRPEHESVQAQSGFSLMEVLVSMALLGIITSGVVPAYLFQFKTVTTNELRTGAYNAALQILDRTRTVDPSMLPMSGSSAVETVNSGSKSFQVTTHYCSNATHCDAANTRFLTAEVSYQGEIIYSVDTIFTQLK